MTEKTAVHTPTKEEYDRLMKAYEKKGWVALFGQKPSTFQIYNMNDKNTCIRFEDNFRYGDINWYKENGYTIITVDEAIVKLGLYERGQEVLVSNTGCNWFNAIYLCTIDLSTYPYHVVLTGDEERFRKGYSFGTDKYQYIKPLEHTTLELTMKEVNAKFGCNVKIIE